MVLKFKGTKIQPLDKQRDNTPSLIPKHPFLLTLNASKGGGKTSVLLNSFMNPNIFKGKFNRLIYVSPTAELDSKVHTLDDIKDVIVLNKKLLNEVYREMKEEDPNLTKEMFWESIENPTIQYIDEPEMFLNEIQEIKQEQLAIKRKYDKIYQKRGKEFMDNIAIIIDDCAGNKRFFKNPLLLKLILNSRHYNCSIIFTTQSYFLIDKSLRNQNDALVLFNTGNLKELQEIYNQNGGKLNWKQFLQMFCDIMETDYQFLTISTQNGQDYKFIKNFEEFIDINYYKSLFVK